MRYYLARGAALKLIEAPSVYQIARDELYELDHESFRFLRECASNKGCESRDSAFIDYCMEESLLTTSRISQPRPALEHSPEPSLRYLELQITDACNLHCRHCYLNPGPVNELAPDQIRSILSEFETMQGLRVLITGGEPLLHTRFSLINEMLPDFALRCVLFTNGLLLTKEKLKTLKVHEIQVSIDGLERAHDKIRGDGSYRRSLEAILLALDAGFAVSISTMVHQDNLADFDHMEKMFKDLKIKDWTVDIPCVAGRLKEHPNLQVTPVQGAKYLGYGFGDGLHSYGQGFGCGLHLMSVLADGRIAKCTFYADKAVGNIGEGLRAAWKRIRPIRLNTLSCNCQYLEICRGGCRYRAELLEGPGGKDPYRCMFYGIL